MIRVKILIFIVLTAIFLAAILLNKAYRALPIRELRRRARSGHDKEAAAVYRAAAYGESLELLLWLAGSLSASALILMAAGLGWWLATLLILSVGFFIFAGTPHKRSDGWQWRAAGLIAPAVAALMSLLQPVFAWAAGFLKDRRPDQKHSGLYEKEDLLELLKKQNQQADSRFSDSELAIVKNAVTFGDKSIGQIMTARARLKLVAASDSVGPMLMDELHKTKQTRFLVVKEVIKAADPRILGSLYIKDLLEQLDQKKTVGDIMHAGAGYINESQTLSQALDAILKTHQHLLVVVNNFEEVSGALSIEQLIEQILGHKITFEFDRYNDLSAVAGLEIGPTDKNHNGVDIAPK